MDNSGINLVDIPLLKEVVEGVLHINVGGQDYKVNVNTLQIDNSVFNAQAAAFINELVKSLNKLNTQLKYGSVIVGGLISWSSTVLPQNLWSNLGMNFLICDGSSFDKNTYPLLSNVLPGGKLPNLSNSNTAGVVQLIRAS